MTQKKVSSIVGESHWMLARRGGGIPPEEAQRSEDHAPRSKSKVKQRLLADRS